MTRPNFRDGKAASVKTKVILYDGLEKRLLAYAVGAGAAAGLLASPPAATAEIVFSQTNISLHAGSTVPINIEGTPEFNLTDRFYSIPGSWSTALLNVNAGAGAGVVARGGSAAALKQGALIGSTELFQGGKALMAGAFRETQISSSVVFGKFANTTNHYLGLKFRLQGQIHYGWARFSMVTASANGPTVSAFFTGYAFETVPNRPVYAGQITELPAESQLLPLSGSSAAGRAGTLEPPSLGLLALGAPGIDAWRRRESLES